MKNPDNKLKGMSSLPPKSDESDLGDGFKENKNVKIDNGPNPSSNL